MTVQVDEPDEKFFAAAFLKCLRTKIFKEAFFIEKLVTMEEIRTRTEKHIDAEEATVSKKEKDNKVNHQREQKGGWNNQKPSKVPVRPTRHFTPLITHMSKINDKVGGLDKISRPVEHPTQMGLDESTYYKFHRTTSHNTDDFLTLKQ